MVCTIVSPDTRFPDISDLKLRSQGVTTDGSPLATDEPFTGTIALKQQTFPSCR
jgi:hypothetical protein